MKKIEADAIRLTSEILRRFWQKDPAYAEDYFADDILWIGAQKDEFLVGIEAVKADLDAALIEIPPCILLHAEFHAVSNGPKCCTVMGKYLTTTDKTANFFLQNIQRCTFVWENTRDGMKVHHIHVSNPLGELQLTDDERFPTTMGKMAQVYMNRQIKQLAESRRISLAGENGTVYSLMQSEIMYITAFSKDSIITSVNGEILIKKGISKLSKMLDGQFIPIHRGYIVNPDYVASLEHYTVTMLNGEKLPVPQKKYNKVRDAIREFYNLSNDK